KLLDSFPRISLDKLPESAIEQGSHGISQAHIPFAVAFAIQTQHSVRTKMDVAFNCTRRVNPEKREIRIRNRIDQVLDQMALVRRKLVVFSAKRHDSDARIQAPRLCDPVAL